MDNIDKVRHMYEAVHGKIQNRTSACIEVVDEYNELTGEYDVKVICTKDGHRCWEMSRDTVLFDFITDHF